VLRRLRLLRLKQVEFILDKALRNPPALIMLLHHVNECLLLSNGVERRYYYFVSSSPPAVGRPRGSEAKH